MKYSDRVERGRVLDGEYKTRHGMHNGAFRVIGPCAAELRILATHGIDSKPWWEHVSVSTEKRPPNWQEMCFVKDEFWQDDEWVVQYHPGKSENINCHPYTLHLWRPRDVDLPRPPRIYV
jgi:hypothetical protein